MSKYAASEIGCCLNRLTLMERKSPDKINPFESIQKVYEFYDLPGIKKIFRRFCKAALADKYSWKDGTPGNLLNFYEQLEGLMEACYLICINKVYQNRVLKKGKSKALEVIEDFFERRSLPEWKQSIHLWLEAGLSNFSVAESIEVKEILPYYRNIEKLLEAGYLLTMKT